MCVFIDHRHHRAGGRRSSEGHEEVESSSTGGSSGQKYSWLHWESVSDMGVIYASQTFGFMTSQAIVSLQFVSFDLLSE